jgi:hypothetical protein
LGKIDKGIKCSAVNCDKEAVRSVPGEMAAKAEIKLRADGRAYLCKDHYKEMKRALRKDRKLQKWRWMA